MIKCACNALGHFARIASTTDIEFVEEVRAPPWLGRADFARASTAVVDAARVRAHDRLRFANLALAVSLSPPQPQHFYGQTRDWIKDSKSEMRRLTAVCILDTLLKNAPALFYGQTGFLTNLWGAIFDQKQMIREKAAETLGTFLMFVHQREHDSKHYDDSLRKAETGLAKNTDNEVHGALLVVMELLNHPKKLEDSDTDTKLSLSMAKTLRDSMNRKFKDFAQCVLDKKSSQTSLIQQAVIALIPILAKFDKSVEHNSSRSTFMNSCSGPSVDFLIASIKDDRNVDASYKSLGELCLVLGKGLPKQMLDQIIETIFDCFKSDGQEHHCDSALQALGMVVRSLSGNQSKKVRERGRGGAKKSDDSSVVRSIAAADTAASSFARRSSRASSSSWYRSSSGAA